MPIIYSLLFFLVCASCTILGLFTLLSNFKSRINILFAIICTCMALWSFGFSIAINAPSAEVCLMGRRIAAVGWGAIFSFVVHFILFLTGNKNIGKKLWTCIVLYIPAAVSLYIFAISDQMALVQYNLIPTPHGWTNVAVNNGWDIMYYCYYIICFLYSFYLLLRWGKKAEDGFSRKQARYLQYAWIASVAIGSLDIFFNTLFPGANLPQMAPIAFMIPVLMIYYSVRKFQFMHLTLPTDNDIILTSRTKKSTYDYLSIVFCAGGFLYFLSQYLMQEGFGLAATLIPSALLFITGLAIQIVTRLNLASRIMEIIYIITVMVSVPAITMHFIDYGSVTIWAFPFVLIIFAMMFKRRLVLISTIVIILVTQALVWIFMPSVYVEINGVDHIGRLGLFTIGIWVAFFVHKAFLLRLKENEDQIASQRLISDISAEMVSINRMNQDEKVQCFLGKIGEYFKADRVRISALHDAQTQKFYCWSSVTEHCFLPEVSAIWHEEIEGRSSILKIPDRELLLDTDDLHQKMNQEGIRSLVSIPVSINNEVTGHFRLEYFACPRMWQEDEIRLLNILSNIIADALERLRAEDKVHYMAYYDHLTNLPNRTLFRDRTEQAIALAERSEKTLAVIFLDLDAFKTINDTMGHQIGDKLICEVASKLIKCYRKTDTVARFGGDEFVIMVNHLSSPADIGKVMESVMDLFVHPMVVNGQELFITASAGVAMYPVDGGDTESLIKSADIAMYHAKEKGKNQYVLCSPIMRDDIQLKMRLTNGLYRALERGELEVYYQPQVELQTNGIVGLEALLRWHHPELGMVSPALFIPLAEQTGLINSIGEWVLRTACSQSMTWKRMGLPNIRMAVNISVNQFRNPALVSQVQHILKETGLNPENLELEITESVAIREPGYIVSVLNELKKLGVNISIDDFGTEYSSLSRLKQMPVDRIKMDMQFVRGIEHSDKDKAISKVIINLAKSLGMKVIAEGVETEGQLEFLSRKMCDEVQGYFFYKPMTAAQVEAVLRKMIV